MFARCRSFGLPFVVWMFSLLEFCILTVCKPFNIYCQIPTRPHANIYIYVYVSHCACVCSLAHPSSHWARPPLVVVAALGRPSCGRLSNWAYIEQTKCFRCHRKRDATVTNVTPRRSTLAQAYIHAHMNTDNNKKTPRTYIVRFQKKPTHYQHINTLAARIALRHNTKQTPASHTH